MLDNTFTQSFEEKPVFNNEFIARNRIKKLTGYNSTKASMDFIRESADLIVYEFDMLGRVIREYKTAFGDTILIMYEYNNLNMITLKRQSDQYGYHTYVYDYDSKGRVVKQEYRRDSNRKNNKLNFVLDESFVITSEKFEYLDYNDSTYKKIYFNNAGKEYRYEFFYFDDQGYLLRQEARLKNGSGRSEVEYTYDDKGRLASKKTKVNLGNTSINLWEYEYDDLGNLLSLKYYRNRNYTTEYQVVYDKKTLFLKALLTRDHATNFITITKFEEVEFY